LSSNTIGLQGATSSSTRAGINVDTRILGAEGNELTGIRPDPIADLKDTLPIQGKRLDEVNNVSLKIVSLRLDIFEESTAVYVHLAGIGITRLGITKELDLYCSD
jgi:hypothetical protein